MEISSLSMCILDHSSGLPEDTHLLYNLVFMENYGKGSSGDASRVGQLALYFEGSCGADVTCTLGRREGG